ncbi:MAG: PH domain-containing protein [Prevotella sp.]|jgi:uncharacterized membrane protein YdbT with pleckstrin-like domain|nr:PH domain-containing protein [Prevotella sp.]MCI1281303.1 PH domain-containing protein [Prevotella sp.]
MDKIFHHHFTLSAKCGIALFTILALYLFWEKMAIAGLFVVIVVVIMMERVMHTSYTLTQDRLFVDKGRFAKKQEIPLNEIIRCTSMNALFGLSHYLLLEYGAGRLVSVQPKEEDLFLKELRERQGKL